MDLKIALYFCRLFVIGAFLVIGSTFLYGYERKKEVVIKETEKNEVAIKETVTYEIAIKEPEPL